MIDLDELERVAREAVDARRRFDNGLGSEFRKLEAEWNIAEMRYEQEATPDAILELVAELREARKRLDADRALLLAEVKRLRAFVAKVREARVEESALFDTHYDPDALDRALAELKEAVK